MSDGDDTPSSLFCCEAAQVESRISSDSRFSGDLTLWDQHGSQVIRGNLIVLPLADNRLIVIEPVYIEAEQTKIPMLARVVLGQLLPDDRKIEWASTLADAERPLVGAPPPTSAAAGRPDAGTGNETWSVRVRYLTRCSGNMRPATSRVTTSFSSSLENCSSHTEISDCEQPAERSMRDEFLVPQRWPRMRTSLASLMRAARYVDPPWSGCSFLMRER